MARKIGFQTDKERSKKSSIAAQYLDKFRAKSRASRSQLETQSSAQRPDSTPRKRNWMVILFLLIWLVAWSFGILMVIGIILSGGGEAFLYIWLTAASIGWIVAISILLVQIRGFPISDKVTSHD